MAVGEDGENAGKTIEFGGKNYGENSGVSVGPHQVWFYNSFALLVWLFIENSSFFVAFKIFVKSDCGLQDGACLPFSFSNILPS